MAGVGEQPQEVGNVNIYNFDSPQTYLNAFYWPEAMARPLHPFKLYVSGPILWLS